MNVLISLVTRSMVQTLNDTYAVEVLGKVLARLVRLYNIGIGHSSIVLGS